MAISSENIGNIVVLSPEGRIDSSNSESFNNDVSQYIAEGDSSIVLNFDKVEYISSACLRALLLISKRMKEKRRKLVLCGLSESVNKIIKVSGFDSILSICADKEAALNSL